MQIHRVPIASVLVPISGIMAIVGGLSILPGYNANDNVYEKHLDAECSISSLDQLPVSSLFILLVIHYCLALIIDPGVKTGKA